MSEVRKLTLALLWSGVIVMAVFGYIATWLWVVSVFLLAAVVFLTVSWTGGRRSSG